jgi:hypothetical protein
MAASARIIKIIIIGIIKNLNLIITASAKTIISSVIKILAQPPYFGFEAFVINFLNKFLIGFQYTIKDGNLCFLTEQPHCGHAFGSSLFAFTTLSAGVTPGAYSTVPRNTR